MTSQEHDVAASADLADGTMEAVTAGKTKVLLARVGGAVHAVAGTCPHAGGPLCEGVLSGFVSSPAPGRYTYERRGEFLRCPWHQWEFDIRTGRSWVDPVRARVRSYQVGVEPGADLLACGAEPAGRGRGRSP